MTPKTTKVAARSVEPEAAANRAQPLRRIRKAVIDCGKENLRAEDKCWVSITLLLMRPQLTFGPDLVSRKDE
jgi:hypothetical protein